jgi:hypothetical protein
MNKEISSIIESSFDITNYRLNKLSIKTFERCVEISTGWGVKKDSWDAMIFQAKKDIRVFAIGIHGSNDNKPRDFTIGYKYIL